MEDPSSPYGFVPAEANIIPIATIYDPVGCLQRLSNFAPSELIADCQTWPSAEHLFQSRKFEDIQHKRAISQAPSAGQAKALAWSDLLKAVRNDWDAIRLSVMREVLSIKLEQDDAFRDCLLETWPWPIFEDSITDGFWGIGRDGGGENHLGQLLEKIRGKLVKCESVVRIKFSSRPSHRQKSFYRFGQIESYSIASSALTSVADLSSKLLIGVSVDALIGGQAKSCDDSVAAAFTAKYKDYTWEEDVRSVTEKWGERMAEALVEIAPIRNKRVLVAGGGVGQEARQLWARIPAAYTFYDLSEELVSLALNDVRGSSGCVASAQSISHIVQRQFDVYVLLRVFQSYMFDISAAFAEAQRVLVSGGKLVVSVADGYRSRNGTIIRGQIIKGNELDVAAAARYVVEIVVSARRSGFRASSVRNIGAEIVLVFQKVI